MFEARQAGQVVDGDHDDAADEQDQDQRAEPAAGCGARSWGSARCSGRSPPPSCSGRPWRRGPRRTCPSARRHRVPWCWLPRGQRLASAGRAAPGTPGTIDRAHGTAGARRSTTTTPSSTTWSRSWASSGPSRWCSATTPSTWPASGPRGPTPCSSRRARAARGQRGQPRGHRGSWPGEIPLLGVCLGPPVHRPGLRRRDRGGART